MATSTNETIEEKSNRVKNVARELAREIQDFLAPSPTANSDAPTGAPPIPALDQIALNLEKAESSLEAACKAFIQLESKIRNKNTEPSSD